MADHQESGTVTLCDALDRVLSRGVVVHGDVTITVADVELLRISLRALVAATDAIADEAMRVRDQTGAREAA